MRSFDHDYVDEVIARLEKIPADAKPAWGTMDKTRLIGHLILVVRFSMGRFGKAPDQSTWVTRNVLRPLLMLGIVRIPKNVKVKGASRQPDGIVDLETLHAVLEEYLQLVQADELVPPPHPMFGELGVDGWAWMHYRHFEHHLKQFGV